MKVLLVLPAAEHLRVQRDQQKIPKRSMLRFSILPLTTVAALTPPEHRVSICDENVTPLEFEQDVDVVGISFMTALAPRAYEIAEEFRRRGVLVVAGGYHPTFMPDEACKYFDAVVMGDANQLWPQLLLDAEQGRLQKVYRHCTPPDLATTPIPRRDLMETTAKHYATSNAIQVSRGCYHNCRYCSVTAFHQGTLRHRPLLEVVEEIKSVGKNVIFVDDNILADREYAKQLFSAMIPLKKRWVSQCSIKIADDPEMLTLAHRSGCRGLFIGIETTCEKNLKAVGKEFNHSRTYADRIKRIRSQGIAIIAGIIVGMDQDETHVFQSTLEFLQRCRVDALQLNIMTPLPGTALFEDYRKSDRLLDLDWSHYDFRNVVIKPLRMSPEELQQGADWLYSEFYRLDRILLRTMRTLFSAGPIAALLGYKLNMTYRYDNQRERIKGANPQIALGTM